MKLKEHQINTYECAVFGLDELTICNHASNCKSCPKLKEAIERGMIDG